MYICIRGIDFASFCDLSVGFRNYSDSLVFTPPLPEGGGGILFYLCPSVRPSFVLPSFRPSKIFFVAFLSVTVDGRNLIFGHKHHIGIPYCG